MKLYASKKLFPCGSVVFKTPEIADAALLLHYFRTLFHESADELYYSANYYDDRNEQEQRDFVDKFNQEKSSFALFAYSQKTVIGHLVLKAFSNERAAHRAVISMGVLKNFQRNGIGGSLLQHAIEQAEKSGIYGLELRVRECNHAAIRLYESFHFSRIGKIPAAAKVGEDFVHEYLYVRNSEKLKFVL